MTKPDGADSVDRLAYNKYPTDEEIEKMNKSDRLAELLAAYGEYCYYDGDPKRGGTNLKDTAKLVRQWISEGIKDEDYYEHDGDTNGYNIAEWRNEARQEIRQRLGLL